MEKEITYILSVRVGLRSRRRTLKITRKFKSEDKNKKRGSSSPLRSRYSHYATTDDGVKAASSDGSNFVSVLLLLEMLRCRTPVGFKLGAVAFNFGANRNFPLLSKSRLTY